MPCHAIACIVLMAVFVHLGGLQLAESVERGQICMAHTAMRTRGKKNGVKLLKILFFWQNGVLANGPWPPGWVQHPQSQAGQRASEAKGQAPRTQGPGPMASSKQHGISMESKNLTFLNLGELKNLESKKSKKSRI